MTTQINTEAKTKQATEIEEQRKKLNLIQETAARMIKRDWMGNK